MEIKKEIIILFIIVVFVIVLEFFSNNVSKKITDKVIKETNNISNRIYELKKQDDSGVLNEEEKKNVEKSLEELKKLWLKEKKYMALFFEHVEIEKITRCILVVQEDTKNNSFANALEAKNEMIYLLNYLNDKDKLTIENVF